MIWLLLFACVGPGTAPDMFMAHDGEWTFDPDHFCDAINCRFDEIDEIVNVIPEVDGVVEVVNVDPTTFSLRGETIGDTLVAVSGMDGGDLVERYVHITVAPISIFRISLRCDASEPNDLPWVLPINTDVYANYTVWDNEYNDLLGYPEFEAEGMEMSELDPDGTHVTFTMPDQPGDFEVTSPLTTDFLARFQVVDEDQYDAFEAEFWPDEYLPVGDVVSIRTALLADGQRLCKDDVRRVATISTPEICSFYGEASTIELEDSSDSLKLYALAAGTCEVDVSVPDFGWSEQLTAIIE